MKDYPVSLNHKMFGLQLSVTIILHADFLVRGANTKAHQRQQIDVKRYYRFADTTLNDVCVEAKCEFSRPSVSSSAIH